MNIDFDLAKEAQSEVSSILSEFPQLEKSGWSTGITSSKDHKPYAVVVKCDDELVYEILPKEISGISIVIEPSPGILKPL